MFSCVGSGKIQLSTTTGNAGRFVYACESHNLRIVRNVPVFKLSRSVVVDVQAIGHGDFAFMKYRKRLIPIDLDKLECGICHEWKSRSEFSDKQLTKKSGTPPRCKMCVSKIASYSASHPQPTKRVRQKDPQSHTAPEKRYKHYYREGFIYFVQDVECSRRIKIGFTTDLRGRIRNIQAHSPVRIEVLTYITGNRMKEAELHRRFAKSQSHYEWYEPTSDLLEFIDGLAALQRGLVLPAGNAPISFAQKDDGNCA